MPKKQAKELVTVAKTIDVTLTKDDIVNVAVAEAEKRLKNSIKDLRARITVHEKAREKLTEDFPKDGEKELKVRYKKRFDKIAAYVTKMGLKHLKAIMTFSGAGYQNYDEKAKPNVATITIQASYGDYHRSNSEMPLEVKQMALTATQKSIAVRIETINKNIHEMKTEVIECQRKLQDIPSLQRQMSAEVSKTQLSQTEDGDKFLKAVNEKIEGTLKLIGG